MDSHHYNDDTIITMNHNHNHKNNSNNKKASNETRLPTGNALPRQSKYSECTKLDSPVESLDTIGGTPETAPIISFSESGGTLEDEKKDDGPYKYDHDDDDEDHVIEFVALDSPDCINRVLFEEGAPPFRRVGPPNHRGHHRRPSLAQLKSSGSLTERSDDGITSDEDEDEEDILEDAYEEVLGRQSEQGGSPFRNRTTSTAALQLHVKESPVKVPCVDLQVSPNFAELFRVFEKPKQHVQERGPIKELTLSGLSHHTEPASGLEHKTDVPPLENTAVTIPNQRKTVPSKDRDDVMSTTTTEITSNTLNSMSHRLPHLEVLQQEVQTLKTIMRHDSLRQLTLKKEMEAYREEQLRLLAELALARDSVDLLRRERDLQREKENEDKETIKVLKREVDKLTAVNPTDIEQLQTENDLFASQIIRNECELKHLRDQMEQVSKDGNDATRVAELSEANDALQKRIVELEAQLQQNNKPSEPTSPERTVKTSSIITSTNSAFVERIEIAEERLQVMDNEWALARQSQEEQRQLLAKELRNIRQLVAHNGEAMEPSIEVTVQERPTSKFVEADFDGCWEPLLCCLTTQRSSPMPPSRTTATRVHTNDGSVVREETQQPDEATTNQPPMTAPTAKQNQVYAVI